MPLLIFLAAMLTPIKYHAEQCFFNTSPQHFEELKKSIDLYAKNTIDIKPVVDTISQSLLSVLQDPNYNSNSVRRLVTNPNKINTHLFAETLVAKVIAGRANDLQAEVLTGIVDVDGYHAAFKASLVPQPMTAARIQHYFEQCLYNTHNSTQIFARIHELLALYLKDNTDLEPITYGMARGLLAVLRDSNSTPYSVSNQFKTHPGLKNKDPEAFSPEDALALTKIIVAKMVAGKTKGFQIEVVDAMADIAAYVSAYEAELNTANYSAARPTVN